jgi:hypothetical protein
MKSQPLSPLSPSDSDEIAACYHHASYQPVITSEFTAGEPGHAKSNIASVTVSLKCTFTPTRGDS